MRNNYGFPRAKSWLVEFVNGFGAGCVAFGPVALVALAGWWWGL